MSVGAILKEKAKLAFWFEMGELPVPRHGECAMGKDTAFHANSSNSGGAPWSSSSRARAISRYFPCARTFCRRCELTSVSPPMMALWAVKQLHPLLPCPSLFHFRALSCPRTVSSDARATANRSRSLFMVCVPFRRQRSTG